MDSRIHTHTQRGSFKCPNCHKSFARSDSLRRHITTKHTKDKEFLCSNSSCERSKKGQGFNRRDKLKDHENSSCKNGTRSTSSSRSTHSIPPETVSQLSGTASPSFIYQGNSSAAERDDTAILDGRTLEIRHVILELQRRSRAEEEALLIKEKECQDRRERLANLDTVIKIYESDTSQNQEMILELRRRFRAEEETLLMEEKERQDIRERFAGLNAVTEIYKASSTAMST